LLHQHRRTQQEPAFAQRYQGRAGIEGTISQAVRSAGVRTARFLGEAKTRLQHLATATALNWCRLADWLVDHSPAQTRISAFAELPPTSPPPLALALP